MGETLSTELVRVRGPVEAEMVRSILENDGIPVRCRTRVLHAVLPFTVDGLGEVCIFVAERDLSAAEDLLARHRQAGLTIVPDAGADDGDESDGPDQSDDSDDGVITDVREG